MRFASLDEWLVWQQALHPKSIDLGLARVRQVYERMALPAASAPMTLTVGGTNGKGSSVAMLDAVLRAQGYHVGSYTSPHLVRYNERIRIDGEPVPDRLICESFQRVDEARGEVSLSFFEFGTLAALDIFSREALDAQVLEVGLGGRLDAVNLIDADGALIASIDIDHQDWFGNSRESIALEKAGILRAGRPAVIGDPAPPDSLLEFAAAQGIELSIQGRDFRHERQGTGWTLHDSLGTRADLPLPAIAGEHQLLNASAAIQLLDCLRELLPVSDQAIREGLREVKLSGRLQFLDGPLPVLLDVAHNRQSVEILAEHIRRRFPGRVVHAVFAVMRDKEIGAIVQAMTPLIRHWYLAPLADLPRVCPVPELAAVLAGEGISSIATGFAVSAEAFAAARRNAQNGDLIVVFGTFPLVAEFLAQSA
jgi:dihydrofolate synthase / folylpolyglutamate synthase